MFHKTRQVLHECVIILKCEITFTVTQFHRVRKIQNISIVGDSGIARLTWRIWIKRKNNVGTMCFLGWGANASLKLRLFDTFLTLVKLRSTYRWNVFANLSYHCYSVSEVTMPSSPEMPESQKCSQIFNGKPDWNLFRVFSVYMIPKIIWIF